MKKKVIAMMTAVSIMAGMLIGCGSDTGSANDSTVAQTKEEGSISTENTGNGDKVVLRFSWWGGEERHQATLAAIEKYESLNPNVTIELSQCTSPVKADRRFSGYMQKVITQLAGNTAADVVQINWVDMPALADQNLLADLRDMPEIELDAFDESAISPVRFDDKVLGLLTGISTNTLLYNKEFTDKFGLDMTQQWTWDEFLEYGKKIHEENPDYYLLNAGSADIRNIMLWYLAQKTGEFWIDSDYNMPYTKEDWTEAFTLYKNWIDNGILQPLEISSVYDSKKYEDPAWTDGRLGICLGWTSDKNSMSVSNTLDIHIGTFPVMEDGKASGLFMNPAQIYSIPESCENKEEAAKFLNWMLNDPEAAVLLKECRGVPASNTARTALVDAGLLSAESSEVIDHANSLGSMEYTNVSTGDAQATMMEIIQEVGFGLTSPADAAEKLMEQNAIIIDKIKNSHQ